MIFGLAGGSQQGSGSGIAGDLGSIFLELILDKECRIRYLIIGDLKIMYVIKRLFGEYII